MEFSLEIVLLYSGLIGMVIILLITQKRHNSLKKRIEAEVQMFKKAFDISEVSIIVLSDNNKLHYANQAAQKLLSLPKEYIDKPLDPMPKIKTKKEWIPLDKFVQEVRQNDNEKMHSFPQSSLSVGWNIQQSIPVNFYVDRSSMGKSYRQWYNIIAIYDLSKEYEWKKAIYRHKLTKLPNQLQALEDLNKFFSKIHLHNKKLALLLFDIDNLSQVRSMIGYEQCENILIHFSQYLGSLAKESSFYVYHTYSNSFLLCIPTIDTVDEVVHLSKQIQRELGSFYRTNDVGLHLTASVGISIYPDSGSALNLMDRAYKALVHAQKKGYGHIHLYKKSVLETTYDELDLFNAIHEAIEKSEFEIYYQPIVRSKDKEVVAAEALIRWKHEKYGYIPPDVFIPILEKSGSIIDLGRYVLSEVLKQQKRWEVFRFKAIEVSINMSLLELETKGFVENVSQMLAEHQVAPELIKFEITEGVAMGNEIQTDRQLHELKKLGVAIALDDFGTGYTSFSYLKKFPVDVLKIDKSIIEHIMENKEDQRIIKAMIDLAHSLGMKIVVEGIENKEIADLVTSYKCDYMQGYYFGRPLPSYEFQELIRR